MYLKGKTGQVKLEYVKSGQVSGGCLAGVLRVAQRYLEGIYGMSKWYVRYQDVSEGIVRTCQVRKGKVRTSQVRTGHDRCLEGVWQVS